jgi:hypothetical protein
MRGADEQTVPRHSTCNGYRTGVRDSLEVEVEAVINIRRLAAVDLAFLGPWIILPEFALGVLAPIALGVLTLWRSEPAFGTLLGVVAAGAARRADRCARTTARRARPWR